MSSRAIICEMTSQAPPPYELTTRRCTMHAGRYRWDIVENGKPIESSKESFATRKQAHTDGLSVMQRLTRKRACRQRTNKHQATARPGAVAFSRTGDFCARRFQSGCGAGEIRRRAGRSVGCGSYNLHGEARNMTGTFCYPFATQLNVTRQYGNARQRL